MVSTVCLMRIRRPHGPRRTLCSLAKRVSSLGIGVCSITTLPPPSSSRRRCLRVGDVHTTICTRLTLYYMPYFHSLPCTSHTEPFVPSTLYSCGRSLPKPCATGLPTEDEWSRREELLSDVCVCKNGSCAHNGITCLRDERCSG